MADLYFDRFAESKTTTVHHKETVAIYRMPDLMDDSHAVSVRK
jgi:hypothetical protein